MLNRGLLYCFVLAIVLCGCNEPASNSGTSSFNNVKVEAIDNRSSDARAVQLYVDAMMLNDIRKWDEALQKLTAAIEYAPNFSLAWSFKGDIYKLNEQYEMSADSYENATKIDPWSFGNFAKLGKVCQILEDFSRAVRAYVTACELNTDDYDVHLGAGRCYYELEDHELAFGYVQRAREINPKKGAAEVLLGDIYVAKEDLTGAIDAYRRALEVGGNKPKTMVALAIAYIKQEQFDSAEELLNDAVKIDSKNSTAYHYLGFVQLKLHSDDLSLAMNSYKKAVKIDDKDYMAYKGLGIVYMLQFAQDGEEDQAIKKQAVDQWNISLRLNPDQPDLKVWMERLTAPAELSSK